MSVLDNTYNNNNSGFEFDVYEPGTDEDEQRLKIAQKQHGILCGRPGDKIPGLLDLPYHLRGPVMYGFNLPKAYLKLPVNCSDCLLHLPAEEGELQICQLILENVTQKKRTLSMMFSQLAHSY